jgi:hypothetical protein
MKAFTPFKYESADDFYGGYAAVKLDGKWGYIDREGKEAISFRFKLAYPFRNGKALVTLMDDKMIWINYQGRPVE